MYYVKLQLRTVLIIELRIENKNRKKYIIITRLE